MELSSVLCPNSISSLPLCPAKFKLFGSMNHPWQNKGVEKPSFVATLDSKSSILECPGRLFTGEQLSGEFYNYMIRDYCRVGKYWQGYGSFGSVGRHRHGVLPPSFISYTYLIEALGSVGSPPPFMGSK
ncbi:hypothetical protein TorRG33x02_070850 [Trema orientale]|uniref:Uncharacterized protein n=1 Tax=Trema orientale TaxID=63057 RepID=A0A2P5FGV9_TREOI|nr:hypothetical protein TorRG33x02_070850 [Trema orientale]